MFVTNKKTHDIAQYFRRRLSKKQFTQDRSGSRTIELLGACFEADKPAIFGTLNTGYLAKEMAWYDCQSLNINTMESPPAQWRATASPQGEINSNYGYLLYHADNGSQYAHVLAELRANPNSRRACAVYTRPSMHQDWCAGGKNDFVCTNAVTYYVRAGLLHTVVQMRSNDVVYGYKNDRAWQLSVSERLCAELTDVQPGRMIWQVQNLHVYERHFKLI